MNMQDYIEQELQLAEIEFKKTGVMTQDIRFALDNGIHYLNTTESEQEYQKRRNGRVKHHNEMIQNERSKDKPNREIIADSERSLKVYATIDEAIRRKLYHFRDDGWEVNEFGKSGKNEIAFCATDGHIGVLYYGPDKKNGEKKKYYVDNGGIGGDEGAKKWLNDKGFGLKKVRGEDKDIEQSVNTKKFAKYCFPTALGLVCHFKLREKNFGTSEGSIENGILTGKSYLDRKLSISEAINQGVITFGDLGTQSIVVVKRRPKDQQQPNPLVELGAAPPSKEAGKPQRKSSVDLSGMVAAPHHVKDGVPNTALPQGKEQPKAVNVAGMKSPAIVPPVSQPKPQVKPLIVHMGFKNALREGENLEGYVGKHKDIADSYKKQFLSITKEKDLEERRALRGELPAKSGQHDLTLAMFDYTTWLADFKNAWQKESPENKFQLAERVRMGEPLNKIFQSSRLDQVAKYPEVSKFLTDEILTLAEPCKNKYDAWMKYKREEAAGLDNLVLNQYIEVLKNAHNINQALPKDNALQGIIREAPYASETLRRDLLAALVSIKEERGKGPAR